MLNTKRRLRPPLFHSRPAGCSTGNTGNTCIFKLLGLQKYIPSVKSVCRWRYFPGGSGWRMLFFLCLSGGDRSTIGLSRNRRRQPLLQTECCTACALDSDTHLPGDAAIPTGADRPRSLPVLPRLLFLYSQQLQNTCICRICRIGKKERLRSEAVLFIFTGGALCP